MTVKDSNKLRVLKRRRTTEELIEAAKQADAKQDRSRKTLTDEEKAELELKIMMEDSSVEEAPSEIKKLEKILVHDPNKEWDVKKGDPIYYFDPTLSYELTGYRPITATEGLDFDPKLFTEAADSFRKNGRYTMFMPGTFKNKQFWDQEWERCKNGLTIGKYTLTGRNYFWLNYYRLESSISDKVTGEKLRTEDFPGFLAKQYEYFHYLELCRLLKKDSCVFKARGVGCSEIAASNECDDYTFFEESLNITTAFLEDYVQNTLNKIWMQFDFLNTNTDGAFRHVRQKYDQAMHKRASKVDKDKNESGWKSEIIGITHDHPRKLRGFRANGIVFEEAGSDPVLETTYTQAEALVRVGGKRVGTRIVQGTGGESGPALAGLNKMFNNPEAYKILPYKHNYSQDGQTAYTGYFIPAYTMWFGDDEGNLGFDSRGVVYEDKAKEHFIKEFNKIKDPHLLLVTKAEFCFTPEDAFILEGSNRFDQELLVDQLHAITMHKTVEGPKCIKLHWKNDEEGKADTGQRPTVEFVSDGPIKIVELPKTDPAGNPYSGLYVAGIDAIDTDSTTSTGQTDVSQFCMVIMRRAFGTEPPKIVAIYKERPQHIQTAFATALKLCQFYNCMALVEATRISVKTYFEKEHQLQYLMKRPQATANTSKRTNFKQYGVPATEAVIDHYLTLIEQYIVDYSTEIQFPDMLEELIKYSYAAKRKFDIVAAMGMCLLADEEMIGRIARPSSQAAKKFETVYVKNEWGQMEFKTIEKRESNGEQWTISGRIRYN